MNMRPSVTVQAARGFTLLEMVIVVAILGVITAIVTPLIASALGASKERSYDAETDRIQAAVDAYYSSPRLGRFLGRRQFPVIGRAQTQRSLLTVQTTPVTLIDNGDPFTAQDHDGLATTSAIELWNPRGGTIGLSTSTVWSDGDSDGLRTKSSNSSDTWTAVSVTRGSRTFYVDPRYYFIDFEALLDAGMLKDIPESASPDNAPEASATTYTGSYIWYVDDDGGVRSFYVYFPSTTGYVDGVFP